MTKPRKPKPERDAVKTARRALRKVRSEVFQPIPKSDPDAWLDDIADDAADVVNKQRLAQMMGLSVVDLDGAPVVAKGRYNSAAVFAWYTQRRIESMDGFDADSDFDRAKVRRAEAAAARTIAENCRRAGETLTIAESLTRCREAAGHIPAQLRTLCGRLVIPVAAEPDNSVAVLMAEDEIEMVLTYRDGSDALQPS